MRDVSIFSSKYQKKQRRKKIIKRIFLVIILLVVLFFVFRNPILDKINKVKSDINKENHNKQETLVPETSFEEEPDQTPETEVEEEEELYNTFKTSFDEEIKVIYKEENGEKLYEEVLDSSAIESDISPSKKAVIILEKDSQDLFYMDIDGNVTDITYKTYVSSKGYRESKESILNRLEGFIWSRNPKFLDDDTVVYLSSLPWFDERQFLYVVELDPLNHYNYQNVKGVNINLLELTEEGLQYEVAGKKYYLTEDFKIKAE
ncbi:MAG: hypothetical protein GX752_01115 [Clostridium sp.]|nr:hypothetical protein [Clostridium sp.]